MIKIAVASEDEMISGHFGHCKNFNVYEIEDGRIVGSELIPNPEHRPGFLPGFLSEKGVTVVLAGNMGRSAQNLFKEKNIEVVVGAEGKAEDAVAAYLAGELVSDGSTCGQHHRHHHHDHQHHHQHRHHCRGRCGR